jgi:hypothetical protein
LSAGGHQYQPDTSAGASTIGVLPPQPISATLVAIFDPDPADPALRCFAETRSGAPFPAYPTRLLFPLHATFAPPFTIAVDAIVNGP